MTFWRSQFGPLWEHNIPPSTDAGRQIGTLVCPKCNGAIARLFDGTDGIAVRAWVPAEANVVTKHHDKTIGWLFYTVISDEMAASDGAPLHCWNGHGPLMITAELCRDTAQVYREKGRRIRRPATLGPHGHNVRPASSMELGAIVAIEAPSPPPPPTLNKDGSVTFW